MAYKAEIPYGAYWSTPFARWQGAFANLHSLEFAAHTARKEFARRAIPVEAIGHGVLGFSVPQAHSFYGLPWVAGRAGLGARRRSDDHAGLRDRRARAACCRQEIEAGMCGASLAITCDRTSNGPHLYYPNPRGPGGTGAHEDWVLDNFGCDPLRPTSMMQTAENVAAKHQITTAQQHEVVLAARAAVPRCAGRRLRLPEALHESCRSKCRKPHSRRQPPTLDWRRGHSLLDAEGLAALKPVLAGGTVTTAARRIRPTATPRSSSPSPQRVAAN